MSLSELASQLSRARRVAVLTGAGVSAESGLRTFRGNEKDMGSLWKDFDPMRLATPEAFEADPEMVTRWYDWRRLGCLAAEPNPGHLALAQLERLLSPSPPRGGPGRGGPISRSPDSPQLLHASNPQSAIPNPQSPFTLLTQNVDRLHQRAGSRNVVELHGTIMEWRCTKTGEKTTPGPEPMKEFPPRSRHGAHLRPDVVWFGEALPEDAIAAAQIAAATCDVFISVGTSSVVYPAAGFIHAARARGAFTAEVNAEDTVISSMVDVSLRGRSGDILPRVLEAMQP